MIDRFCIRNPALLRHIVLIAALGSALLSATASELAIKSADKEPPKELDASIRGALQPRAMQVAEGGKPLMEFWLRKEVPLQSKPESPGKAMDAIKQATLLGAVSVSGDHRDYRDDTLPTGVYTMRFALQPQDGNHLGTAEFNYFAVLTPARLDTKLDGITDYKQLVKASSKETSTDHPIILSLRPPSAQAGDAPKIVEPAAEHKSILLTLSGKTGAEAAPVPVEIVVEGKGHK